MTGRSSTYHRIYSVVEQIPSGQVTTYGQVGHVVGCPARQVGYAMAALESDSSGPWHRVINRRGLISIRRDGVPDERQRRLLQAEGIVFSVSGVIDLACYSWEGPDWSFLAAEGMNPLPDIC